MGLDEASTDHLSLGPVPVDKVLRIGSTAPLGAIVVHDASGRAVHRSFATSNYTEIDLQGLNNGSYVVRTGANTAQRFIVAH